MTKLNHNQTAPDWKEAETRDSNIDVSLDASTSLQVRTDSTIGSGDILWVRFVEHSTNNGPGIKMVFSDPPIYSLGYCADNIAFTMCAGSERVWTISKGNGKIKLECDGEVIFDIDYATSRNSLCKYFWSLEFGQIKFQGGDTASDSYRSYVKGMLQIDLMR